MSEIHGALKAATEGQINIDKMLQDKDGEMQNLMHLYAISIGKEAEIANLLSVASHERTPAERKELNKHALEVSNRMRKAAAVLATIEQRDLGEIFAASAPDIPEGGLGLYIKGIGVKNPAALKRLHEGVTEGERETFGKKELAAVGK